MSAILFCQLLVLIPLTGISLGVALSVLRRGK